MIFVKNNILKILIFCLCVLFISSRIALWIKLDRQLALRDQKELEARERMKAVDEAYDVYILYVDQIKKAFIPQIEKELNCSCFAHLSTTGEKIEKMRVYLEIDQAATIAEARALLLFVMDKYLKMINAHKEIQPYLIESPFNPLHLDSSIRFHSTNAIFSEGCVSSILNTSWPPPSGKIVYWNEDPFESELAKASIRLFEESYEEAVKANEATPLQNPFVHKPTKQEVAFAEVSRSFVKSIAEDHKLECWSIGEKNVNGTFEMGCYLVGRFRNEQEEARELIVILAKKLLQILNENENIKPLLNGSLFTSDQLKITLNFEGEHYGLRFDGSTETVILENNQISYYRCIFDEFYEESFPSKKVLYLVETYPEAEKIVENFRHSEGRCCINHQ